MTTTTKPLMALTAGDLMSHNVVMLPKEMSLRKAARLLSQHQISGAPVVDDEGRCIGIVSSTDFIKLAENEHADAGHTAAAADCLCAWQMVEPEQLPADQVGVHMTRDPVMVVPQATIGKLARLMIDAHIHRVVVRDEAYRPIGVVSSTDILAAIAKAEPFDHNKM
jgi:CBS domain-containing protein